MARLTPSPLALCAGRQSGDSAGRLGTGGSRGLRRLGIFARSRRGRERCVMMRVFQGREPACNHAAGRTRSSAHRPEARDQASARRRHPRSALTRIASAFLPCDSFGRSAISGAHGSDWLRVRLPEASRSAVCVAIREGRSGDQVDGVGALETGDETFTDPSVDGAVRRRGLVRKAGEVLLDEVFLETFARVLGDDFLAQRRRQLVTVQPFV